VNDYQDKRKKKQQKSFKEDRFGHKELKEAGQKVYDFFTGGKKKKKKKKPRKQAPITAIERARAFKKGFKGDE